MSCASVRRVSETTFTFEYSAYTRRVRAVYLPVTLTAGSHTAHLVMRVDCASTYCVLERPWAEYFELSWESRDLIHVVDCNRNGSGLQSAHFQDHIICIYPPPQDSIKVLVPFW